jgi:hypothetical protein
MKYHELQIKAIERCAGAGANHMTALLTNEDRSISVSQHVGIDAGQAILASLHELPNLSIQSLELINGFAELASVKLLGVWIHGTGNHKHTRLRVSTETDNIEFPLSIDVGLMAAAHFDLSVHIQLHAYKKNSELPVPEVFKNAFQKSTEIKD